MTGSDTKIDARPSVARAQQLLRDKRHADALQVCTDEAARGIEDPQLRLLAAQSLLALGRHEAAKREAQQAVRLDPTLADAHRVLAEVASKRGELRAARQHLERVLELDPDDDKSLALLDGLDRSSAPIPALALEGAATTPVPRVVLAASGVPGARAGGDSGALVLSDDDLEDEDEVGGEEEFEESATDRAQTAVGHVDVFSGESFPVSDSMIEALPEPDTSKVEKIKAPGPATKPAQMPAPPPEEGWKPSGAMDAGAGAARKYNGTLRLPALGDIPEEEDAPTMPLLRPSAPLKPQLRLDPLGARPVSGGETDGRTPAPAPAALPLGAGQPPPGGRTPVPTVGGPPPPSGRTPAPLVGGPPPPSGRTPVPRMTGAPPGPPSPLGGPGATLAGPGAGGIGPGATLAGPGAFGASPSAIAPPAATRALNKGAEFEEFGVEDASVPLAGAEPKVSATDALDPRQDKKLEQSQRGRDAGRAERRSGKASGLENSDSGNDLLGLLAGEAAADDSLSDIEPAPSVKPAGRGEGKAGKGGGKGRGARSAARRPEESLPGESLDPERDGIVVASEDELLGGMMDQSSPRASFGPDDLENQLAAAATATAKSRRGKRRGSARWVLVAVLGMVIGGGGLAGYLWYRSYKYVQGEWATARENLHRGTPEGYRAARSAAERIVKHRNKDAMASAAMAMCDAAMSIDFGDDRLKAAKDLLEQSKGSDSEWRTAANAFLALIDEPARAEGYLQKGIEVYPESGLLHYLRGRALAASGAPEKAAEAFRSALKLVPNYVAARIALAVLQGQESSGYAEALAGLDEILKSSPDNLQALIERARLRTRHGKELEDAASDAQRVTGDLASRAARGQIGWARLVLAQVALQGNKSAVASTELDEATKSPPCCDSSFRHELAGELMKLYRMADALTQMQEALKLQPKHPDYLQRIARVLLDLDDAAGASTHLQNAPARHPETRFLGGRVLLAQGHHAKAIEAFRGVLAESKAIEPAIYLALAQARQSKFAEAVSSLEKLAADHQGDPTISKALGRVHLWHREYAKADAALKAAWKLTKVDPAIPTLLGDVSMKKHEPARAKKRYERALSIRPEYRQGRLGLAVLLMMTGKLAEARQQLDHISEVEKKKPDVLGVEARINLAEGRLDAAKTAIAEAESAGATAADLARLSGELALLRKDAESAEDALKRADKATGGEDSEILVLLGRAELMADKIDQAYDTLQEALDLDPGDPIALLELGRIAIKDGELAPAVKRLTEALARMKERMFPATMLAQVHSALGEAHLRQKDTGRAITNLQDAMDLDGNAAEPQWLMGQTYDKLDRPQRAVQYYARALQLDPSRVEIYEALGAAYAKQKDAANAIKSYEEFLRRNPPAAKARVAQRELEKLRQAADSSSQ